MGVLRRREDKRDLCRTAHPLPRVWQVAGAEGSQGDNSFLTSLGQRPSPASERSPFCAGSGRNHKETCAGCIVSLTTPTSSLFSACRSVSSLSFAEKASSVFLASYFLR